MERDDFRSRKPAIGGFLRWSAVLALLLLGAPGFSLEEGQRGSGGSSCMPTRADSEGPFYIPGAPLTTATGTGLNVSGQVLGSPDCRPIAGARIEWWQTNRSGRYDGDHRGSQVTDSDGNFRFATDFPGLYPGRPAHIHFKASAPGFRSLTTQLYLRGGEQEVSFPIVLAPR